MFPFFIKSITTSGSTSGGSEYPKVNTFADLPSASSNIDAVYIVRNTTGTWILGTQKVKGMYRSNGTTWDYLANDAELTSIKVGTTTVVGSPVEIVAGDNITLTPDGAEKTITISSSGGGASSWNDLADKPLTFTPSAHTQDISTINGLVTALGGKQDALGFTPENVANKGANNGYCGLDSGGKVPIANLPTTLLKYQGVWNASTNNPALTSPDLTKVGNVYNVGTAGTQFGISFGLGDWLIYNADGIAQKSDNSDDVVSVNGQTGVVSINKSDVGLGNVDNTSDVNKPISTATQTALDAKQTTSMNVLTADAGAYTYTLPLNTQTNILNTLPSGVTTTIALTTPVAGQTNESVLHFNAGAVVPTLAYSFTPTWLGGTVPTLAINKSYTFVFEQVRTAAGTWIVKSSWGQY